MCWENVYQHAMQEVARVLQHNVSQLAKLPCIHDRTSKKFTEAHDETTEDANKAVDRVHVHDVITRRAPDLSKACVTSRLTGCML